MKNKRKFAIIATLEILLLIPLIAMQFTDEVNWTFIDFFVAGILLLVTGLLLELVLQKVNKINYRIALIVVVLLVIFLIWAELAVGIFGSPFAGD
jgi:asparagine N-glycosylation enzyme membrane subunit Stt3